MLIKGLHLTGLIEQHAANPEARRITLSESKLNQPVLTREHPIGASINFADASAVTMLAHFLRLPKLYELPQLWNLLKGEMSRVGPRLCLCIQTELIDERESYGVYSSRPEHTGLGRAALIESRSDGVMHPAS